MAQALRVKQNIFTLNLDRPLQPTQESLMRINQDNVHGVIVNKQQQHWVAFRILQDHLWFLDSQDKPKIVSFAWFLQYVEEYRQAFLIQHTSD